MSARTPPLLPPLAALIGALLLTAGPLPAADDLTGAVVRVQDGDSILVRAGEMEHRIVLWGVDAPELKQEFGDRAKAYVVEKLQGKTVRVVRKGTDRYQRVIGQVFLESKDFNEELVRLGYAWAYTPNTTAYKKLEGEAKAARKGLWAAENPRNPADFRREERTRRPDPSP